MASVLLLSANLGVAGADHAGSGGAGHDSIFPTGTYNGGSGTCTYDKLCLPDNTLHTYFYSANLTAMKKVTTNRFNHWESVTKMANTKVTSYTAATDVLVWNDPTIPQAGRVYCITPAAVAAECDAFSLAYDTGYISDSPAGTNPLGAYGTSEKRWLACHEIGHTYGLMHGNRTDPSVTNTTAWLRCMINSRSAGPPAYSGAHNQDEVDNANF